MNQEVYPDKFELISIYIYLAIWPNSESFMEFFENSSVNEIVLKFKNLIIEVTNDENRK